ncbi:hypothetical protein SAMN04489712_10490 [Thermomonospora echinospora]|uniref:Uncharacterized protein n=1 Tax=Thermomonospora echinospora TaxID=1992 RepID=A0A1H5YMW3_9ACTN|nr:hypothetical protein SAMN04489712_10490 [Thermomonospora echinospora]
MPPGRVRPGIGQGRDGAASTWTKFPACRAEFRDESGSDVAVFTRADDRNPLVASLFA